MVHLVGFFWVGGGEGLFLVCNFLWEVFFVTIIINVKKIMRQFWVSCVKNYIVESTTLYLLKLFIQTLISEDMSVAALSMSGM